MQIQGGTEGPKFIEGLQNVEKSFLKIKEAFSDIKPPSLENAKQELENAQILSKQVQGKLILKMWGKLAFPGSRDKIIIRLEKMTSRQEITENQLHEGKMQAEDLEVKTQEMTKKWGEVLITLGKSLKIEKLKNKGVQIFQDAVGKNIGALTRKSDLQKNKL
jgi:hypothetical protein